MKKVLIALLKYVIAFGIGGFLIWLSLHSLSQKDIADIKAALSRARMWLILPVFAILMLSHVFRCLRWKQLLVPMGFRPPVFDLVCALMIGYIGNQLIPRAGEILRCTVITKKNKIPFEKLIGTIIAERVIDLVCLAVLCVIVFFAEYSNISSYADEIFSKLESVGKGKWILPVAAIAFIIVMVFIIRKLKKSKWGKGVSRVLKGIREGLVSVKQVKNKLLFFIYTAAIWFCYIISTWIGCFTLEETTGLPITTAMAMLIFGTFGIIIAPGGLGAYPVAIQKTLIFYGINGNIGLAVGWLLWLAQFIFTLLFGTLAYIALTITKNKNEEHSSYSA